MAKRAAEKRREQPTQWVEWAWPKNPHVKGRYTAPTFDEDGIREEQRVEAQCTECGHRFKRMCSTGAVRTHIQKFARIHRQIHHGSIFDQAPRIERPKSLRRTAKDY